MGRFRVAHFVEALLNKAINLMDLNDGFYDVPKGKVATVVTHLEMHEEKPERPVGLPDEAEFHRIEKPTAEWYKELFHKVGAADWLWFSRLNMTNEDLEKIGQDEGVEIYALTKGGQDLGLLELDFRQDGQCELAFFGVARELMGFGAGRFLMNKAIRLAWSKPIKRFHVHTCTLDSPQALPFYVRSGFAPYKPEIEIAPDPRLKGLIDRSAAPQIPIIE